MNTKNISKSAQRLITTHLLLSTATIITGSFFSILIWRLKNDITYIAYFELMYVLFTLFGYIISGFLLTFIKSKDVFRLSFIILILAYGLVLHLQENLINFIYLIGIIQGLGYGIYWGTYNLLELRETTNLNRENYFGIFAGMLTVFSTLSPALIGLLIIKIPEITHIDYSGYYLLYAISISIFLILIGYVEGLPLANVKYFDLKQILKISNSKKFRYISFYGVLAGFLDNGTKLVFIIFSFMLLKNEFNIGILASLSGLLSGLYIYLVGRKLNIKKRSFWIFIGALFLVVGKIIFVKFFSLQSIVIDRILSTVGNPLFGLPAGAIVLSTIENRCDFIIEKEEAYLVAREIPLGFGRFIGSLSFLIFLLIVGPQNFKMISIWFFVVSTIPIIQWYVLHKISKIK